MAAILVKQMSWLLRQYINQNIKQKKYFEFLISSNTKKAAKATKKATERATKKAAKLLVEQLVEQILEEAIEVIDACEYLVNTAISIHFVIYDCIVIPLCCVEDLIQFVEDDINKDYICEILDDYFVL